MNINIFLIISYNFVVFVKFDNKLVCLIFFLNYYIIIWYIFYYDRLYLIDIVIIEVGM